MQINPTPEQLTALNRTWAKSTSKGRLELILRRDALGALKVSATLAGHPIESREPGRCAPQSIAGNIYCGQVPVILDEKPASFMLTREEATELFGIRDEQMRAFQAIPTADNLVHARARLADNLIIAHQIATEAAQQRFDRYDASYANTPEESENIRAAQAALVAFDAAHPEALEEIRRRSESKVERFLKID